MNRWQYARRNGRVRCQRLILGLAWEKGSGTVLPTSDFRPTRNGCRVDTGVNSYDTAENLDDALGIPFRSDRNYSSNLGIGI